MEIKKMLENVDIIGVVSNYQMSILSGLVKDLKLKNIEKALLMVGLDNTYLDKKIEDLTISEQFKIDLVTKLDKEIIIVGNLSKKLIYKDIEYIKKLLLKLCNDYNKKVVVIDEDITVFINLVKHIYVINNKNLIFDTNDFYDNELYKYVKMPKIIEFVNFFNKNGKKIANHLEIYELIKDIYRSVS